MSKQRVLAAAIALLCVWPALAEVRPISDAEQAAVQIAADYLSRGPAAVTAQLAASSPLKTLPSADAEIEVRLGPPAGAQWELQTVVPALKDRMAAFTVTYPAGLEDHVIFDMVKEGAAYKVRDLRFLAQASDKALLFPKVEEKAASAPEARGIPLAAIGFGLLAAALSTGAAMTARNRSGARAMIAVAVLLVAGGAFFGINDQRLRTAAATEASVVPQETKSKTPRLAPLLEMRRVLASGHGDVDAIFRAVDRTEGRGAIADLWKIQSDLLQADTAKAKAALARFPSPSDRPLAELLRGRVALLENDEVAAAVAFEQAVNLGPGRDAVWYENADVLYGLGFEDRAKGYYERLAKIGSRDADVYYSLSMLAAAAGRDEEAEKYLRQAWNMRPIERADLIGTGVFWSVVRRPGVTGMIAMSAAAEPLVRSEKFASRPILLPVEAEPRTSGDFLHVAIGEQQLTVPGGAALAPPGASVVEATAWANAEKERHLSDLPDLLSVGTNAAAFAQPAMRQRITGTTYALAARNRWSDLVQLTEGLSPASEHVPANIFFLRSVGLQRMQRSDEAKKLLAQVAVSPVLQRRRDAAAFAQLAELFAAHDLFDAAVRMYDRSQSIRPNPFIDDRVRQITMNKRLATKYSTTKTEHFEIHFPEEVTVSSAIELGQVLEAEYTRLQSWIPTPNFQPVVVNVVWWQEFRSTYTGSDFVLGFYNGKITVPFAGLSAMHPFLRNILAHELSHAMIAQSTLDQAPRWFQEGFAQRIERRDHFDNAFNMYDDTNLLPLPLLDAVMHGSPDPEMISAAYIVSQTDIRFLEARYGKAALGKMMAAFRDGATTEEAIRRVCNKSVAEFETELRQWGRAERRVFGGGA